MKNWNWKAIALGADILLLVILALGLGRSVVHQSWIAAQICLLALLLLLSLAVWLIRRLLLEPSSQKPREDSEDSGTVTIVRLVQFTGCGVAAIIIYAIQHNNWRTAAVAQTIGMGLLTAAGSLAAGAVFGFLFGVPRSQSAPSNNASGASTTGSGNSGNGEGTHVVANTNLEQISDWLTKTIVGVSLVELSKLPPLLDKLARYVASGMSDAGPGAKAAALVIIVCFLSLGFLISYLWTRMRLTRAFGDSTLSRRIGKLERQSKIDAKAIADVDRWLHQHSAIAQNEDKARSDMTDDIKKSSSAVKGLVFITADGYKRDITDHPETDEGKEKIRKASVTTLPIFQALVEADQERIFHRNRSQYAFSLMTQTTPEWQKALDALNDAIKIRDNSKEPGWVEYEFARAICRIHLEGPNAKSIPAVKNDIDADLTKADKLEQSKRQRLDLDGVAEKWLKP